MPEGSEPWEMGVAQRRIAAEGEHGEDDQGLRTTDADRHRRVKSTVVGILLAQRTKSGPPSYDRLPVGDDLVLQFYKGGDAAPPCPGGSKTPRASFQA